MHRLIMNSRTYQQSSAVTENHLMRDPQNRLLSRMPLRRMDAEALRDSVLFVSRELDETAGGPPDPVTMNDDGLVTALRISDDGWRRSIYLQYRRTEIPTMMETFDYPEMGPNCLSRNTSTVTPQSLLMMNNERVHELAEAFATRVQYLAGDAASEDAIVNLVYNMALSRSPDDEERRHGLTALSQLNDAWNGDETAALTTYCHTILNSAAFLFID